MKPQQNICTSKLCACVMVYAVYHDGFVWLCFIFVIMVCFTLDGDIYHMYIFDKHMYCKTSMLNFLWHCVFATVVIICIGSVQLTYRHSSLLAYHNCGCEAMWLHYNCPWMITVWFSVEILLLKSDDCVKIWITMLQCRGYLVGHLITEK